MTRRGLLCRPYLDGPQRRIRTDRLGTTVNGEDLDVLRSSNVFVEPVGQSVMLMPAPLSAAWNTNGAGDNARLQKADYILTPAKWREESVDFVGDYYLLGADPSGNPGEAVVTSASQPVNGSMYLRWFAANSSAQDWVQLECGYGANPADGESHPLSFRVYASGKVEVWRYGTQVGQVNISGSNTSQQTANTFTDMLVIPGYRRREVLILSNRGHGGSVLLDDVSSTDLEPMVVPAVPFWWNVPEGLAKVQCAGVKFAASGYICGIPSYFREPVASDAAPGYDYVSADLNGGAADAYLVEVDNVGATFTPDDVKRSARVRVDLTGTGTRTPQLYGAHLEYLGVYTETPNALTDLSRFTTRMSMSISDSPSDSRVELTLKAPNELRSQGITNLTTVSNRPFGLLLSLYELDESGDIIPTVTLSTALFSGRTEPAKVTHSNSDRGTRVEVEVRDGWKALENYRFSERVPLDGMTLKQAFLFLLASAGFSAEYCQIDDIDFELPRSSTQEWAVLIEVGDTAAEWLTRLHENYCATWFMGFRPAATVWSDELTAWIEPLFKFVLRDDNPRTEADAELYCSAEDWLSLAGDPPTPPEHPGEDATDEELEAYEEALAEYEAALDAYEKLLAKMHREIPCRVFRSFRTSRLEPEANDIWCTGLDLVTRRPIQAHKADYASQDPTAPAHLRPTNWLGEVRKYGLFDSTITSQEALERAVTILYDRLTPTRVVAEFTCDMLIREDGAPIWRGDVVKLHGRGGEDETERGHNPSLWRVKAVDAEFEREPSSGKIEWRPTRYVVEKMQQVDETTWRDTSASLAGSSLAEVVDAHRMRGVTKAVHRRGSEILLNLMPAWVVEAA